MMRNADNSTSLCFPNQYQYDKRAGSMFGNRRVCLDGLCYY
ncbi:unknown [Bacteroides sp. CAG:927]|nr:unknown [Bacteroides sp. CAG:927]